MSYDAFVMPARTNSRFSQPHAAGIALIVAALLALDACSDRSPAPLAAATNTAAAPATADDSNTGPAKSSTTARVMPATADAGTMLSHDAQVNASRPDADAASPVSPTTMPSKPATPRAASDAGSPAAEGCSVLATGGDDALRTLELGGLKRAYRLHVPRGAGGTPVPLLVDLHGLLTHAAFERASSGYLAVSDANGFIVVYPEALEAAWNSGDCCAATQSIDDLGFIRALVDELAASGCIDLRRVYAAGVSAGGGLAQQLACQAADKFAAVLTRDWDLLEENSADCKPARPIALLSVRSQDDPRLPYAGGEIRPLNGLNATLHPLGALKSFQRWAALDQCQDTPEDRANGCQVYAKCAAGVEVGLCTRAGAPGSIADDAAAGWEFLRRFQLP